MLSEQNELVVNLAKLRNEPKGITLRDKIIIDRLIKELRKRQFEQSKLDEFTKVYQQIVAEFEKQKVRIK